MTLVHVSVWYSSVESLNDVRLMLYENVSASTWSIFDWATVGSKGTCFTVSPTM